MFHVQTCLQCLVRHHSLKHNRRNHTWCRCRLAVVVAVIANLLGISNTSSEWSQSVKNIKVLVEGDINKAIRHKSKTTRYTTGDTSYRAVRLCSLESKARAGQRVLAAATRCIVTDRIGVGGNAIAFIHLSIRLSVCFHSIFGTD